MKLGRKDQKNETFWPLAANEAHHGRFRTFDGQARIHGTLNQQGLQALAV